MDARHIATFTTGRLPMRPADVDPGLLTNGDGNHEWKGFLAASPTPSRPTPRTGYLVNWNQNLARGFGAADNEWMRAGAGRPRRPAQQEPGPPGGQRQADAGHRDLGDERRRRPRTCARSTRCRCSPGCCRARPRPRRARSRCSTCSSDVERARAAAASTATSTARSTTRAPRSWTPRGPRIANAFMATRSRAAARRAGDAGEPVRPARRAASTAAGISTSTRTSGRCLGDAIKGPFSTRYCGSGRQGPLPGRRVGGDQCRGHRARGRAGRRPHRLACRRDAPSGSSSCRACCR